MLILTEKGLYCPAGKFYIDPSRGVDHAVITHAHSDHARRGSKKYFCEASGEGLLRERLGQKIKTHSYRYGKKFDLNGVTVSFHSAGHILGSAQVRLEKNDVVWVVSGDYKRETDPTCAPFEPVKCDVFVTEATFGTPSFRWKKDSDLGFEIFKWWKANSERGVHSILFAYSLGKAQRVLGVLKPWAEKPVICHPAAARLTACYREQGIALAPTRCLSEVAENEKLQGELLLVPQSFLNSEKAHLLEGNFETAFASGWMAQGDRAHGQSYDRGFVMSDHADWDDLLQTIQQSEAKTVYVQHRGHGALVKHLRSMGIKAFPDSELKYKEPDQLSFF